MINEVQKHKLPPSPREPLLEKVSEILNDNNCEKIQWSTLPKATRTKPPPNTIAIVVDVVENQGAIHITEENGTYVDMVGTECAGHLVVVPWDILWWLRGSGSIEVGYVIKKVS